MKLLVNIFWKILPFTPLIILLSVIIIFVNYYRSLIPKENIREAVGTIIGYDKGGTSMRPAIILFKVKQQEFFSHCAGNYNLGEKFIIEYEEKKPDVNKARLDKPVFLNNETTGLTTGIISSYNPIFFRKISFIYFVDGIKYEQSYKPIKDSEIKYPNLKEGKKYKVRYWEQNPQRSIILLDKPDSSYIEYN